MAKGLLWFRGNDILDLWKNMGGFLMYASYIFTSHSKNIALVPYGYFGPNCGLSAGGERVIPYRARRSAGGLVNCLKKRLKFCGHSPSRTLFCDHG